ncbi:MAG: signal recognition particle-docking protein FtsY [Deltaproteobacteria bacterium]|nr:signal recognition particle-docking protein FtsY [Deltaproteobacteria bacterium]
MGLSDQQDTTSATAPAGSEALAGDQPAAAVEQIATTAPLSGVEVEAAGTLVPAPPPEVELPWGLVGGSGLALLVLLGGGVAALRGRKKRRVSARKPIRKAPEGLAGILGSALTLTKAALQGRFDDLFGEGEADEAFYDELEEVLLSADVGMPTTQALLDRLREHPGEELPILRERLQGAIRDMLQVVAAPLVPQPAEGLRVILVVGVNGSGKTTTIGKLAARFRDEGHKVMMAAADTYRAAAGEQLTVWAERSGADIVAHQEGADPGAVTYDALQAATARGCDVVIVDTAGRLQTRKPLMQQLSKIERVIKKVVPDGPHETLLVVDGTMGQNAISQAQLFHEATPLTGVVVTKLDGTAKGGMILTVAAEMKLPVKLIGIGEKVSDLKDFDVAAFVEALT